jgi:hypothetical protein
MALGPGFGSLLNNFTKNAMFIFYIAVASDLIFALFVALILPESLSPEAIKNAAEARRRSKSASTSTWWRELLLKLTAVLTPLTMFLPRATQRSGGRKRYDWNASFIGIAYSCHAINSVSCPGRSVNSV